MMMEHLLAFSIDLRLPQLQAARMFFKECEARLGQTVQRRLGFEAVNVLGFAELPSRAHGPEQASWADLGWQAVDTAKCEFVFAEPDFEGLTKFLVEAP